MRYDSNKIMDTFNPKLYLDEIDDIMNSLKITDALFPDISGTLPPLPPSPPTEKYRRNQRVKIKPTNSLSNYLHNKAKIYGVSQQSIYPMKSIRKP
jgi:hypothetical protein